MDWGHDDDIVDQLIANNAARPIPGMEKPDMSKFRMPGRIDPKKPRKIRPGRPRGEYVGAAMTRSGREVRQ